MPEWLASMTVGQIVAYAVGLSMVATVFFKTLKFLKPLGLFLDQWNGKPAVEDASGNIVEEAVPGALSRIVALEKSTSKIDALQEHVEQIHYEVKPNHGGSIKDAVKRIEDRSNETAYKLAETTVKLDEHIIIAKESDKAQEKLVEDVGKLKSKYAPES